MNLPSIMEAEVAGKTVLLRADLNVPIVSGEVSDRTRVAAAARTIEDLLSRGARVVVMAHLDRPKGVANPVLSIQPVARALAEELKHEVQFVPDCVGAVAERQTRSLPEGAVALLENLRFHAEEELDDRSFALMLSVHGDLYVNDAPACSVRRHASIDAIVPLMPAYAGPLLLAHVAKEGDAASTLPGVAALMNKTRILEKI
ncbi:MAG: phosphoglycerate kinase [Devosia sp.]